MSGMDLFLFNHDRFKALYNCSFKTDKEWSSYGVQNTFLSALFLLFGFVYIVSTHFNDCFQYELQTTYIPILIVMVRPKLFKNACFKIMFFLGIIDMLSTVANCLIPGYFGLIGAVGCSYINFLYVAGSYGLACWFGQCALCVTLGLNRLIDFVRPHWMPYLFDGPKTFFGFSYALAIPCLASSSALRLFSVLWEWLTFLTLIFLFPWKMCLLKGVDTCLRSTLSITL
ncbi:hypothetical protein L596_020510 [Steinernema carpocapsae]|uniref:G-protein coupled receptors family 1 profile domain-containing protein n=1 Tax=Steinernema carpocapsae TaxID=34508 RepID=A0A4U5MTR8_STECR|nr:hypothetical protein L596_020510 [Steinernema carpocapsae]